ncbi:MAG: hypothetical protein BZY80_02845 [SAR202 cluster bacterium Io17-Chloro-G2]|nr:MAG: hypothetical protein BZY80_02845 [SAR202 cluster bacterium Io17-Chloro-G2]
MQDRASKSQKNRIRAVGNQPSREDRGNKATIRFIDNRPEAIQLRNLHEIADNSFQVKQLEAMQDMADKDHQAANTARLQAMAGRGPNPVARRMPTKDVSVGPAQNNENKTGPSGKGDQPETTTQRTSQFARDEGSLNVVQRLSKAGDPLKIAEEEYALVASGKKLKYTALSAGCMAVTVMFKDGGGGGVHMAMEEQGKGQWTGFLAAISGKTVKEAHINCDSWGSHEDWRVKKGESSPMSTLALVMAANFEKFADEDKKKDAFYKDGWVYETASILDWFKGKLGVKPNKHGSGSLEYTMP